VFGRWKAAREAKRTGPARGLGPIDLSSEMERLAASLGSLAHAQAPGYGRVLQFVAARSGEGTSTVAREFAWLAAARLRKRVWLVDAGLMGPGQINAIAAHPGRYGSLGGAAGASPDGSCFFGVRPQAADPSGRPIPPARYLVAHPVSGPNLWVTRFRREQLAPGQSAYIVPGSAYWDVMRKHAELVIIDAPAADRSQAATLLAPHADATVLVVAADAGDSRAPAMLSSAIAGVGGRVAGLFYNRAEIETLPMLQAIAS
jgi:Mrp family chromosome partitioning ATPase